MGRIRKLLSKVGLAAPPTRMGRWVYPMPTQRALYFAVPKVACTTWLRICCRAQGVELGDLPPDAWFDAIPRLDRRDLRRFAGWRRFGFVRNPWDRLVSCYLSKILSDPGKQMPTFVDGIPVEFHRYGVFRAGMPFSEFARACCEIPDHDADDHFVSQHRFFDARPRADVTVERFEDAAAVFPRTLQALGLPADAIPHDKRSVGRDPYVDYYGEDRELVAAVGRRYAEDARRYGYVFDGVTRPGS